MGLFGGGKGGSRPPDPMQAAQTQMDLNRDVMRQNALYSQIGQRTPFAQTYYTGEIGGPDRQQHTQFHPLIQALLFGAGQGGGLFNNMIGAMGGIPGGAPQDGWREPIPFTPQEFLAEETAERDAMRRAVPTERPRSSGGGSSDSDSESHGRNTRNMGHSSHIQGAGRRSGQGRGLVDIMAGSGDRTRTAHLQGGKSNVLTGNTPRHRANIAGQIVDAITGNDRKSRTTRSDRRNASRKSRSSNSRSRGGGGKGGSR